MRKYRMKTVLGYGDDTDIVYQIQTKRFGLWWTLRNSPLWPPIQFHDQDDAIRYIRMREKRNAFVSTYISFE